MPGTVPGAMPGTVPNGPFAPDRMNATAYAPTESKRRKPAGPIVVLSILGLTFLSFAGLMGLIWVNDMGIIGIMRLGTIWIAAVCIVMGLVVIIFGFRGRRTGGLIPLGLVAGGCALCMTIVSGTYGVYYRDLGASGINTVVSLSQSVSARNSDGMNDVQKDGIFVADASDATFETLQQGVAFSGENYNTDQAIIDWSDWDKTHGPHTVKMLDGKTFISNCPAGTITIAATQAQVHIVLPDSCTYAFGTADSYSTSSDVGGKYEMVYNNYMGLISFGFFEAESATNPMNGPDYEWLYKESAMPDNGPELKININRFVALPGVALTGMKQRLRSETEIRFVFLEAGQEAGGREPVACRELAGPAFVELLVGVEVEEPVRHGAPQPLLVRLGRHRDRDRGVVGGLQRHVQFAVAGVALDEAFPVAPVELVLLDQLLRLVGQGPFLGRVFIGFHQHDASFLPLDDRCRAVRRAWLRSSAHTGGRAGHGVYVLHEP